MVSPKHPYSLYDQSGVPLELSPCSSSAHRRLFSMESEGEIPVSSPIQLEVSGTHTPQVGDEKPYEFPPEGFPYTGAISSSIYPEFSDPLLSHGYTFLAQLVLGAPSALSLYQNPIWSSGTMPTSCLFIQNMTSRPII